MGWYYHLQGEWAVPSQSVNSSPFIILNLIDLLLGSTVHSQSETHTRLHRSYQSSKILQMNNQPNFQFCLLLPGANPSTSGNDASATYH